MLLRSFEIVTRSLPPGLPIPITCIGEIALDAVKMGVDPRGLGAAIVLHKAMRPIP